MSNATTAIPVKAGRNKRRLGIVVVAFLAVMGGAIAIAAWTSNGTGDSGSVAAGTATPLVITQGTPAIGLTPGTSKDSTYTITNPNTYPVTVTSITLNSIGVTGGTGLPAPCTSANSAVTATAGTGAASITIAAAGTSAAQAVTLTMGNTSANGCQTAVFTPNITAATN